MNGSFETFPLNDSHKIINHHCHSHFFVFSSTKLRAKKGLERVGWRQIINKRPPQPDHYRAPAGSTALSFFAKILWQHWELALGENMTSATILTVFLGVERKYVDNELIHPSWPYNLPPTLKIITRNFQKKIQIPKTRNRNSILLSKIHFSRNIFFTKGAFKFHHYQ